MFEVVTPMFNLLTVGRRLCCGEHQGCGGCVVAIGLERHRRFGVHRCLFRSCQRSQGLLILLLRNGFCGDLSHAVQRLRRVVRPKIGAVTPDAAVGHQAVPEEYRLTFANIVTAEHGGALLVYYLRRNRRCVAVGQHGYRDQPRKAEHHYNQYGAYPPR